MCYSVHYDTCHILSVKSVPCASVCVPVCVLVLVLRSAPAFEVVPVCIGSVSRVQPELPVKVLLVKDESQTSAFVLHVVLLVRVDFISSTKKLIQTIVDRHS